MIWDKIGTNFGIAQRERKKPQKLQNSESGQHGVKGTGRRQYQQDNSKKERSFSTAESE